MVPFIYWYGGKKWGVSSNLQHLCAAVLPAGIDYFRYDWWRKGAWHLSMAAGMVVGGLLASTVLGSDVPVAISAATAGDLAALGITDQTGLVPPQVFSWGALLSLAGFGIVVVGGFLIGFGARYGNGCTSGHAVSGLSNLQRSSLVVVVGFFVGGLISTHLVLPLLLAGLG